MQSLRTKEKRIKIPVYYPLNLKPVSENRPFFMWNRIVCKRYRCTTQAELVARVSKTVAAGCQSREKVYQELMGRLQFLPAGNTLLAGVAPIRPNCTVLPSVTEENLSETLERSEGLWKAGIGIGFDLSEADDPLAILYSLGKRNAQIDLGHRPQRGNMALLRADHYTASAFIGVKQSQNLYNFNLSLGVDKTLASNLLSQLSHSAWKTGDPGLVRLDLNQGIPDNLGTPNAVHLPWMGQVKCVVPCGEQMMYDNEGCTLGAINLACPDFWLSNGELNRAVFARCVHQAVEFLDRVVDQLDIPDKILAERCLYTRRIGLGIMGWADALYGLNIPYSSSRARRLADRIGTIFKTEAHAASRDLGDTLGQCPALFGTDLARRNLTVTCIAPTGGISLLTPNRGFSIEPFFTEASKISWQHHLSMQSIWQRHVDNAVSKTINLPNAFPVSDVPGIFEKVLAHNVKGVTIYRDASRAKQPISLTG